jgi:hypothetical protein
VTATGTARFAVAMGYEGWVGYAVGAIFDIAKDFLLVGVLALLVRRAIGSAIFFGAAWSCLVVFSCLATHATVSTAISSIERTGTWKMEVRDNSKAELTSVERQLAVLSRPVPPRPAKTVREALASERVPPGVWKDSNDCNSIQESAYFARACAQVVQLRRELAAAQDYERLSARAGELRKGLAAAPIVATLDPLPAAFSATLGRVLPIGGTEGVALLLTMVVEIMSSVGLTGLSVLLRARYSEAHPGRHNKGSLTDARDDLKAPQEILPRAELVTLPKPSLRTAGHGRNHSPGQRAKDTSSPPSNIVPMRPLPSPVGHAKGGSPVPQGGPPLGSSMIGAHVPAFVRERLQDAPGASMAARDLRATYESWCAEQSLQPLTVPKFAAELKRLGYDKWKSCGLIRYRGLQLVA